MTRTMQAGCLVIASVSFGYGFLYTGPPPGDPSAWTDLVIGTHHHDGPEHMNHGTFEGGATGTKADVIANNVRDGSFSGGGGFDVPSGGPPSPDFGVAKFTMKMLRFEEFGLKPMETTYAAGSPLPPPFNGDAGCCPDGQALDDFMSQPIYPEPTCYANDIDQNPWKTEIEAYLGHTLATAPCDGRPVGEGWSHQRWDEFPPQEYFITAQNGARDNTGFRDTYQRHGYSHNGDGTTTDTGFSEFGPGGLYHNTAGLPSTDGTTEGIPVQYHPNMPVQAEETVWTFDGTFPPKLLTSCYGKPLVMRHYNTLPIDVSANRGFGAHTISTHEHNGHNPAESDGYANAFFFPGQFFDYRWPMILAGTDSINTDASDPRAGCPDGNGGITNIPGDFRETMSTHWFHDHMLDFTAQNVYKGNAAMMNYYSSMDRGNEALDDGVNLRLPSGSSLDWGNRDYDVNLSLAGKTWDEEGQLWYNPFQNDGMIGDMMLTNWCYNPYMDVRARKYRFRILNASVARYIKLALVQEVQGTGGQMQGPAGSGVSYNRIPFHMIANCGNIMAHAIPMDGTNGLHLGELPVQSIAERFDIIVDFSQCAPGEKVYMVNLLEHKGGRRPEDPINLADVLSETYQAVRVDLDGDGVEDIWDGGDPCVGRFLEFRVNAMEPGQVDLSMNPADYEPGGLVMVEQPSFTAQELQDARHREFSFGRSQGTDELPWTIKTDEGAFNMDPRRLSAAPKMGDVEIWTINNNSGGWSHPVHVHFEEGKILKRDGVAPPIWEEFARKDVYRVGPEEFGGQSVEIAIRFREFAGTYMEHCHNTTHEDTAMLLRWDIEHPGQVKLMPSPLPTWGGIEYVDSFMLASARTGDPDFRDRTAGGGGARDNSGPGGGGGGGGGGGNSAPTANDDIASVSSGIEHDIDIVDNDTDPDDDLDDDSVTITQYPAHGTLEVQGNGKVRYMTVMTGQGQDSFLYTVADDNGNVSNEATVTISIN